MEASEHVDSHLRLTAEERALLAESPHTLDTPLSDDQLHFLEEHGYLVLRKLIEPRLCEAVVKQAFERADALMGLKRHVESTWHVLRSHGMTDLWHLPAQYELYQHPRLYSVFAQLHNTHRLCVSLDRISMKPPCRTRGLSNADLDLHTDLNQWRSDVHRPFYQGGLCLEDCPAGGGGFFCLPGAHRAEVVERYKRAYESGAFANGRPQAPPAPEKLFLPYMDERHIVRERIEVPLERGDFVVWSSFLPHNGGYNTLTGQWRLQAFVRYMPLDGPRTAPDDALWHAKYQRTIALPALKTGERPRVYSTGGSANGGTFSAVHAEARLHRVPELTELGQRLFGLRNWL